MSMCTAIADVRVNGESPDNSFAANTRAIRILPRLVSLLSVIILSLHPIPLRAADSPHILQQCPHWVCSQADRSGPCTMSFFRSIQTLDTWDQPSNSMK